MPVRFFEGVRDGDSAERRNAIMEHRFHALAAAVREHEARLRRSDDQLERQDEALYRRLREITDRSATGEGVA